MTSHPLRLGDLHLQLDASGAIFLPAQQILIVADLHLEKGAAFARRGTMLPPYDTAQSLARLKAVIARLQPQTVISLGDAFHDKKGAHMMPPADQQRLIALTDATDWLWIEGNHDPIAPLHLGGRSAAEIEVGGVLLRHIPGENGPGNNTKKFEIAGHLHPKARLKVRGSHLSRACFAMDARRLILPAFGAFTGGLNVRSDPFAGLFAEDFDTWLLGGKRLHRVASKHLLPDPKSWRDAARSI